ncbi:MAG: efflux RND transporter periplasmic adaptor subunit [Gemmatimonadales bacterium]
MSGEWRAWHLLVALAAGVLLAACGASEGARNDAERPAAGGLEAGAGGKHVERVELTPEQLKTARIAYGVVERRSRTGILEATAVIEPAPTRFARLGARVAGRVAEVRAAEGDPVRAGQVLAVIESPELGQATGDYLAADATANVTREIAERERTLFERKISAEREWRQAEAEAVRTRAAKEAAENRLHALGLTDADLRTLQVEGHYSSTVRVRSPIAGVVATRTAANGQIVQPGDALFDVVDPREVAVAIDVYEQAIGRVRVGQQVEVQTTSTRDRVVRGRVTSVGAVVEPQSRTVKVRVLLPNPDRLLRPGTFATVRILGAEPDDGRTDGPSDAAATGDSALYVPTGAIQREGDRDMVFVKVGPSSFERRWVEAVAEVGGSTQVSGEVAPDDSVVTTGSFALKSELKRDELGEEE